MVPTAKRIGSGRFGPLALAAITGFLPLVFAPARALGQSTGPANLERRLAHLEAGQKRIEENLGRLEAKLDRLAVSASELSQVQIHIQTNHGKPLAGFEVRLTSTASEGRRARASGTSDVAGTALDRFMPYGDYFLTLRGPHGWSALMRGVHIEVGQPFELTIVAPDPDQRGEIELRSGLRAEAFAELPMGEIRTQVGVGYTVGYVPEPDAPRRDEKRYPTLHNGIVQVGARLQVTATQTLTQPSGEQLQWQWAARGSDGVPPNHLLITPEEVGVIESLEAASHRPTDDSEFFSGLGNDQQVSYLRIDSLQRHGDAYRIEVPAGEVEIAVASVVGRADESLQKALKVNAEEGRSIWLSANLQSDSKWIPRLFDTDHWKREDSVRAVVAQTLELRPDEQPIVILMSPSP